MSAIEIRLVASDRVQAAVNFACEKVDAMTPPQATEWVNRQWLKVKVTEPDSKDKSDLLIGLATLRSVIRHRQQWSLAQPL